MTDIQKHTPDSYRPDYSDEIDLVELVATFIRRRKIFYAVFIVISLAGLAYALLAEDEYEYVSLIQVAQKGSEAFFQSPETTIATLENRWLPEVETIYRAKNDEKLPFGVSFSNPESTGLIRFTTTASQPQADTVKEAHQALIKGVKEHQQVLIKREHSSLERQIASLDNAVETLKGQADTGAAIASAIERRARLEGRLKDLQAVEVLVTSRQSATKTAPKRSLIVTLAVLLGGMLGVFLVFMSEFAASVRSHIASEGAE